MSWHSGMARSYAVATDGINCWIVGDRNINWEGGDGSTYASVWKLDSDGNVVWSWDSGSYTWGVATDGTNCWAVGNRTQNWEGGDGSTYASVWKLDSNGNVVWHHDAMGDVRCVATSGGNCWIGAYGSVWKLNSDGNVVWSWDSRDRIWGVATDGTNCWAVGDRTQNWEGGDGSTYASVWKLDSDGNVVWSWDSGMEMSSTHGTVVVMVRAVVWPSMVITCGLWVTIPMITQRVLMCRDPNTNRNGRFGQIRHIGQICRACQDRLKHPNISEAEAIVIEDCDFIRLSSCRRRRLIKQGKARCPLNRPIFEEQVANDETK